MKWHFLISYVLFQTGQTDVSSSGEETMMLYLTISEIDFWLLGKTKFIYFFKLTITPICVLYDNEQNDN